MNTSRMRMAAVAGSLAFASSLALPPAAMAQDSPAAPMNEILAAVAEGRFDEASAPFCAALEPIALGGLGQLGEAADLGIGLDLDLLLDALSIDVSGLQVEVVDQGETEAVLDVAGTLEIGVEEDGLVTLLSVMFAEGDEPLDEDLVRTTMLPFMQDQVDALFGGSVEVDEEVQVTLEDGVWQVCDPLGGLGLALAEAMGAPVGDSQTDDMDDDTSAATSDDGMTDGEDGE